MNDSNEVDNSMTILKSDPNQRMTVYDNLTEMPLTRSIHVKEKNTLKNKKISLTPITNTASSKNKKMRDLLENENIEIQRTISPQQNSKRREISHGNKEINLNSIDKEMQTLSSQKVPSSLSNSRVKNSQNNISFDDKLRLSGITEKVENQILRKSGVDSLKSLPPKEAFLKYHINSSGLGIGEKNMGKIIDLIHQNLICIVKGLVHFEGKGNIFREKFVDEYIVNPIQEYKGNENVSLNYLNQTTFIQISRTLHQQLRKQALVWTCLIGIWVGVFGTINYIRSDQFDETESNRIEREIKNLQQGIDKDSNQPVNYMKAFLWIHFALWIFFWILHTTAIAQSGVQMLETVQCCFLFLLLYIFTEFAVGVAMFSSREQKQVSSYFTHVCLLISMLAFWIYSNITFQSEIINIRQILVITQQKNVSTLY